MNPFLIMLLVAAVSVTGAAVFATGLVWLLMLFGVRVMSTGDHELDDDGD